MVEWHEEEVRPLDRLEHSPGVPALHDGVAELATHSVEDRRPREEAQLLGRQAGEVLDAKIVGHESVISRDLRRGRPGDASRAPACERDEVKTGGPSLGASMELEGAIVVNVHSGFFEKLLGLTEAQAQLRRAELEQFVGQP